MSSSPRVALARSAISGRGKNVQDQRSHHRNEFLSRLRDLRIQELGKFRNISSESLDNDHLLEIKTMLSRTNSEDLATQQEIDEVLDEINTLLHLEELVNEYEQEIFEYEQSFLKQCQICDKITTEGDVCNACSTQLSSAFSN